MKVIFSHFTPSENIKIVEISQKINECTSYDFMSEMDNIRVHQFSNSEKKSEFIAGRYCASMVTGKSLRFECQENHPPRVEKGYLSIAHTSGHAAAAYHTQKKIGIDIELLDRKIPENVLKRFAHDNELLHIHSDHESLQLWCAKEAVYKAGHISGLEFKNNIQIHWLNNDFGYGFLHIHSTNMKFNLRRYIVDNLISVVAVEL